MHCRQIEIGNGKMHNLIEELLIFKGCENNNALCEAAEIFEKTEEAEVRRAVNRFIRTVLSMAAQYGFRGNLWKSCVAHYIAFNENIFSLQAERRQEKADNASWDVFAKRECGILRKIFCCDFKEAAKMPGGELISEIMNYESRAELSTEGRLIENLKERLESAKDDAEFFETIRSFYRECGVGVLGMNKAFLVKEDKGQPILQPMREISGVVLDDLVGYEIQKEMLTANTEAFLYGKPANNVLLYGDSGTGKSTSIRALLNRYSGEGLRIIQVYRHQMQYLSDIISEIKNRNYKFIIYMDDLSFEDFETEYKYLKAVIEGGIEPKPENVLIYATSNRRHFIKETWNDRSDVEHNGEIFKSDSMEEKRSLADRFGMQIYYGKPSKEEYHHIIDILASREQIRLGSEALHAEATKWEIRHGGVSGRSARQFIDYIKGMEN